MVVVELYFDYSSPWTYLAWTQIRPLIQRTGAEFVFKPILVGAVFNQVNNAYTENRNAPVVQKLNYLNKDMKEWAETYNLKLLDPYDPDELKRAYPFPVNSIKALRGAEFAKKQGLEMFYRYSDAVFSAYWGQRKDISTDEVLKELVEELGMDSKSYFDYIRSAEAKQIIRTNTDEVIERGAFGSPTFYVNEHMYFGNDRLVLLERRIRLEQQKSNPVNGSKL